MANQPKAGKEFLSWRVSQRVHDAMLAAMKASGVSHKSEFGELGLVCAALSARTLSRADVRRMAREGEFGAETVRLLEGTGVL